MVDKKKSSKKSLTKKTNKKRITYECPECGKKNTSFLSKAIVDKILAGEDVKTTCKHCQEQFFFDSEDVAPKKTSAKQAEPTKEELKKVKVPFWMHIYGVVLAMLWTASTGLFLGILGIVLFITTGTTEYRRAKIQEKDPYFAYLIYPILLFAAVAIIMILVSNYGIDKLTHVVVMLFTTGVLTGLLFAFKEMRKYNNALAFVFLFIVPIVALAIIAVWILGTPVY